MIERYGILLLDDAEIILRVYENTSDTSSLIYFISKNLDAYLINEKDANAITLALADLFASTYTEHIGEWRICARNITKTLADEIQRLTGLPIEYLTTSREQELLCKGMFSELW